MSYIKNKTFSRVIVIIITLLTIIMPFNYNATEFEIKQECDFSIGSEALAFSSSEEQCEEVTSNETRYNDCKNSIPGGTILQTFCWNFNTITEHMEDISKANFTAIQVPPICKCKVGDNGGMKICSNGEGNWYYLYQPTDFKIGNYQMGTKEEFKNMCEVAHKYGIYVIVDVVLNHFTSDPKSIDPRFKDMWDEAFRENKGEIEDFNDRRQLVLRYLMGLISVNTPNKKMQKMIIEFLTELLDAGADGIRFDAAMHVETPEDDKEFASDFWPVIISAIKGKVKFYYGEVLRNNADRIDIYSKYINVTDSDYGIALRNAITSNDLNTDNLKRFRAPNVDPSKLITWVESHDNYFNDKSYLEISKNDTKLGWAIIAARKGGTPLFFNRPNNSDKNNPYGDNVIGPTGDDTFKSKEISQLNLFRKIMKNQDENFKNQSKEILLIERGCEGLVIINAGEKSIIHTKTNLKQGVYKDKISGSKFIVKDGTIMGKIDKKSPSVLYSPEEIITMSPRINYSAIVFFDNSFNNWDDVYIYAYCKDSGKLTQNAPWPGIKMTKVEDNLYAYYLPKSWNKSYVIFNNKDGKLQIPFKDEEGFALNKGEHMIYKDGIWAQ